MERASAVRPYRTPFLLVLLSLASLAPAVVLVAASSNGDASSAAPRGLFQGRLPLRVLSVLPGVTESPRKARGRDGASAAGGTATAATARISGLRPIQVVFNRAVIALGSDFGFDASQVGSEGAGEPGRVGGGGAAAALQWGLPPSLVPFSLGCKGVDGIAGRARWVTSFVFRFDPLETWPSDLSCSLTWNANFTAFDGTSWDAASPPPALTVLTKPLTMSLSIVFSPMTYTATGSWSAQSSSFPSEAPPDAQLLLSFSALVDINLLPSLIQLRTKANKVVPGVTTLVKPCPRDTFSLASLAADTTNTTNPSGASSSSSRAIVRCAVVSFTAAPDGTKVSGKAAVAAALAADWSKDSRSVSNPSKLSAAGWGPLAPDTEYHVVMPRGSKYYGKAGALKRPLVVEVRGAYLFHITYDGSIDGTSPINLMSRKITLPLPHGLLSPLADLKACLTLHHSAASHSKESMAAAAAAVSFDLSRPSNGSLLLSAPLEPDAKYTLSVAACPSVRDGFGLPLRSSRMTIITERLEPFLAVGPHSLVLLDATSTATGLATAAAAGDDSSGAWDRLWPLFFQLPPYLGADRPPLALAWPVTSLPVPDTPASASSSSLFSSFSSSDSASAAASAGAVSVPWLASGPAGEAEPWQQQQGTKSQSTAFAVTPCVPSASSSLFHFNGSKGGFSLASPALNASSLLAPTGMFVIRRASCVYSDPNPTEEEANAVDDAVDTPRFDPSGLGVRGGNGRRGGSGGVRAPKQPAVVVAETEVAAVMAQAGDEHAAVWVTWLSDASPVEGATVSLLPSMNEGDDLNPLTFKAIKGTTDKSGIVLLALPAVPDQFCGRAGIQASVTYTSRFSPSPSTSSSSERFMLLPNFVLPCRDSGLSHSSSQSSLQASLVLDRPLYRPGDTVHVFGVIRQAGPDGKLHLPEASHRHVLSCALPNSETPKRIPVTIHPQFATFLADIPLPADADTGSARLQLEPAQETDGIWVNGDAYFQVSDPRPPTVTLSLSTSRPVARIGRGLEVVVTTRTYTGGPVADEEVKVIWAFGYYRAEEEEPGWEMNLQWGGGGVESGCAGGGGEEAGSGYVSGKRFVSRVCVGGVLVVRTNSSGVGVAILDIDAALASPTRTLVGSLSLSTEWVGPTREILSDATSVPVALSDWVTRVTRSVPNPVPGQPFHASARLVSLLNPADVAGDTASGDAPVYRGATATDAPMWDGGAGGTVASSSSSSGSSGRTAGDGTNAGVVLPSVVTLSLMLNRTITDDSGAVLSWKEETVASCNATLSPPRLPIANPDPAAAAEAAGGAGTAEGLEGLPSECAFVVPDVGRARLLSCITDPEGTKACSSAYFGNTLQGWQSCPLYSLPPPRATFNKPSYQVGETATLRFENPYEGAAALLQVDPSHAGKAGKAGKAEKGEVWRETHGGLERGIVELPVVVDGRCDPSCAVTVVVVSPRQSTHPLGAVAAKVPTTVIADIAGPSSFVLHLALLVTPTPPPRLSLDIAVPPGHMSAGSEVEVAVRVTGLDATPEGGAAVADSQVQVLLVAVDKAFLDLMPHPLSDPTSDLQPASPSYYASSPFLVLSHDAMLKPSAIRALAQAYQHQREENPWLQPLDWIHSSGHRRWWMQAGGLPIAQDVCFSSMADNFTHGPDPYGPMPYGWGGGKRAYAMATTAMAMGSVSRVSGLAGDAASFASARDAAGGGGAENGEMMMMRAAMPKMAATAVHPESDAAAADKSALLMDGPQSAAGAGAVGGGAGVLGMGASALALAKKRTNFTVTPLCRTATAPIETITTTSSSSSSSSADPSRVATATFRFRLPDSISTFVLRAYAVTGASSRFGAAETELVASRPLALVPSVPRIVRAGDRFTAGVTVNLDQTLADSMLAAGKGTGEAGGVGGAGVGNVATEGGVVGVGAGAGMPVTVSVAVVAPLSSDSADGSGGAISGTRGVVQVVGLNEKDDKVFPTGPLEVRFNLEASVVGAVALSFTVQSPGLPPDVLVVPLQVEGVQEAVTVASSVAVQGHDKTAATAVAGGGVQSGGFEGLAGQWQEQIALPVDVLPGSAQLNVTAGVGRLPSVLQLSSSLVRFNAWADQPYPSATHLLWSLLPSALLHQYDSATSSSSSSTQSAWSAFKSLFSAAAGGGAAGEGGSAVLSEARSADTLARARLDSYTLRGCGLVDDPFSPNPHRYTDIPLNAYALMLSRYLPLLHASPIPKPLVAKWRAALEGVLGAVERQAKEQERREVEAEGREERKRKEEEGIMEQDGGEEQGKEAEEQEEKEKQQQQQQEKQKQELDGRESGDAVVLSSALSHRRLLWARMPEGEVIPGQARPAVAVAVARAIAPDDPAGEDAEEEEEESGGREGGEEESAEGEAAAEAAAADIADSDVGDSGADSEGMAGEAGGTGEAGGVASSVIGSIGFEGQASRGWEGKEATTGIGGGAMVQPAWGGEMGGEVGGSMGGSMGVEIGGAMPEPAWGAPEEGYGSSSSSSGRLLYFDWELVPYLWLGLGTSPPSHARAGSTSPLLFANLKHRFTRLSPLGKLCTALAFVLEARERHQDPAALLINHSRQGTAGGGEAAEAVGMAVGWTVNSMRVLGRTAYVTAAPGSPFSAGSTANALALLLLVETASDSPLVEKLANHVAGTDRASAYAGWTESALSALALTRYDMWHGSTTPHLALTVSSGPASSTPAAAADADATTSAGSSGGGSEAPTSSETTTILSHTFSPSGLDARSAAGAAAGAGAATAVVSASVPWATTAARVPSSLLIDAQGIGEVSVSVALSFIPGSILPFPTYRGLYVEKMFSFKAPDAAAAAAEGAANTAAPLLQMPSSTPTSSAPVGVVVTVTIQVTTADDVRNLVILDLPPAGLEPLDPNLPSQLQPDMFPTSDSSLWWWASWHTRTTRPSHVRFLLPYLPAGTHTVTYHAMAVTSGVFALPPAKAFLQEQPEVLGLSAGGRFWVLGAGQREPEEGREGRRRLLAVPKLCPNDCSGSGTCNVATGTCICDRLFASADCSLFTGSTAGSTADTTHPQGQGQGERGGAGGSGRWGGAGAGGGDGAGAGEAAAQPKGRGFSDLIHLTVPSASVLAVVAVFTLLPLVLLLLASRLRLRSLAARLAGYRVVQAEHGATELTTTPASTHGRGEGTPMLLDEDSD
ncbi:hypothetical protein CLOP_g13954 [Closterium sp. NIES-67]|nr:hypothetical protein CLOP_g13954 [Closterium sp. NIES-67]